MEEYIIKKCIIQKNNDESNENSYFIYHSFENGQKLREKIGKIKGVQFTYVYNKYTISIHIGRCFNVERILDVINKTVLCFELNNR